MAGGGKSLRDFIVHAVSVWNAKTPGSMNGTHDYIGNYEECLNPVSNSGVMQYCMFDVEVTYEKVALQPCNLQSWMGDLLCPHNGTAVNNYVLKWALCSFASCSKDDVIMMAKMLIQKSDIGRNALPFKVSSPDNNCQSSKKPAVSTGAITFFFIVGAIAVTVIICTIWHWIHRLSHKPDVKAPALVRNWSVIENFLSMTETSSNDIALFHSLKVMTMYYTIPLHELMFTIIGPVANLETMFYYFRIFGKMRVDLAVDTFFAIGGFTAANNVFNSKAKNIWELIFTRYFRYIPTFALVLLYITNVMEYTGRGPFWPMIAGAERDTCMKHWGIALLMLGNYGPWREHCWLVSWYIPSDFHFYIVAILICRLIKMNAKMGVSVLSFLLVISIVYVALAVGYNDYTVTTPHIDDYMRDLRMVDDLGKVYTRSHFRISSYLVGVMGGYVAYLSTQSNKVLSKRATIKGFMWSITLTMLTIYSGLIYGSNSTLKAALYGSLLRPIWTFSLVLFTINFMFGKFNFPKMAAFFEMKIWVPLSKLTFCMYLTHMIFIYRTVGSQTEPFFFCDPVVIFRAAVDFTLTLVVALVLYLCVEKPSYGLFKLTMEHYRKSRKPKAE